MKPEPHDQESFGKLAKNLPLDGEVFSLEGRTAFVIPAADGVAGGARPWVWYAPALPGYPAAEEAWMFRALAGAGLAIAGIDVGESYGSPAGRSLYSALYRELSEKRHLSGRPCLLARSRGGLMLYNWAAEHADCVSCIAGIYPVCDPSSYPGIEAASGAYDVSAREFADHLSEHNPLDRIESLAATGVPIHHIHGDADSVVPLEENSAEMARRYRRLGGEITLEVVEGRGHDLWPGWFRSPALVDFILAHGR